MTYSMITMRQALVEIGVKKGANPFKWEAEEFVGTVNPHLLDQFTYGRPRGNFLNDMLEYCWLVYSKALGSTGPMLIGRQSDLWVPNQLERVGIDFCYTDDKGKAVLNVKNYLWDPHTEGNIQVMDKWAPVVNDCWVLGGVHRLADFELFSVRTLKNLWDFVKGIPVVTAREILGVLHFGYSLKQQPGVPLRLVCADSAKAQGATIEAYNSFMEDQQAAGSDSIRSILVMDPALKNEIEGFDRSLLRHVVPPR